MAPLAGALGMDGFFTAIAGGFGARICWDYRRGWCELEAIQKGRSRCISVWSGMWLLFDMLGRSPKCL
jgi:hypothetical protein